MIARLWETQIDLAQGAAYDQFANTHSRPMFETLPGCLGALFLGTGQARAVLSFWVDQASVEALGESSLYLETVKRLVDTGILRDPQSTRLWPIVGGTLDPAAILKNQNP